MAKRYLKSAQPLTCGTQADTSDAVRILLAQMAQGGEDRACELARRLDGWDGPIVVSSDTIERAIATVPQALRDDIAYAHENIRRFAEAQRAGCVDMQVELRPGLIAGQRHIPLSAAAAYVPGGRYAHIASALMTITTAKVAGCKHIVACSPPRPGVGVAPAIIYAAHVCGADKIMAMGGVQGVAAMTFGLFGLPKANILVGPGNQFVAEAKRILFGRVGIDMFAGPTDSLILADKTADPMVVAVDLVGQAEHGGNSPVWLVTTDPALASKVMAQVPLCIAQLPEPNRSAATTAWDMLAEVILCDTAAEMAQVADDTGPEHLHVQADNLDWWRDRLRVYGSLFLGEHSTVAFGDKASGPNHVLPTSGAARYTGGLSVHKFLKCVTWQKVTAGALTDLARVTAHISRTEGMEGHARSADIRLDKFCAMPRLAANHKG